ncbi:beta strand repeat-containing protein [Sphingomonas montanisoli]|uniref:Autotransporter domain-containing protein n=1 Tax=Sphingomonas montanisoli TaxID=2606412 RepID=A0A5D9C714_9SPHN|nr:hypothetical protein [Sphingomonas montanisoli]TZG27256.1 hypothetical protein FYJ91_06435 [Sphingomonas montanisoli]
MRNTNDPFARHNRPGKKPLFTSRTLTSVLALGTALAAPVTNAISGNFVGNGINPNGSGVFDLATGESGAFRASITGGSGNVARYNNVQGVDGVNTDRVFISSSTAVINWTPYASAEAAPGAINLLPNGNRLFFQADGSDFGPDFTVLNRIIPTDQSRQISLNGVISSYRNQIGSSVSSQLGGGNIWFYSPGGILVGATANINVGGLLLTSLDPIGNFNSGGATFTNDPMVTGLARGGKVQIASGAQIAVSNYIGIVAPTVEQNGDVTIGTLNGTDNVSAAYVAAEDATLTLNEGLFDIQINVGTDGELLPDGSLRALTHGGSTTGPANDFEQNVQQRISLVAVPKNSAVTMLIQGDGQLGFEVANAVQQGRNSIILSGGYNVQNNSVEIDEGTRAPAIATRAPTVGDPNTTFVNINIVGSAASAQGNPKFLSDVSGYATGNASISAGSGTRLDFARNLYFNTSHRALGDGVSATAGTLSLSTGAGGAVTVAGIASLVSNGIGDNAVSQAFGGTGVGGLVSVNASGGSITLGALEMYSEGYGGLGSGSGAKGGNGFGGGDPFGQSFLTGASLGANAGGVLTVTGPVTLSANGYGGNSIDNDGGFGYGGRAVIFNNASQDMNLGGFVDVSADAQGGNGFNAGGAAGGFAQIGAESASIITGSGVNIYARAVSGEAFGGFAIPLGGEETISLRGGTALLSRNGAGGTFIGGAAYLDGSAYGLDPFGGEVFAPTITYPDFSGASARGGQASVFASGGGITLNNGLYAYAEGYAGINQYGDGGVGIGGFARVRAINDADITIFNEAQLLASGYGGVGFNGGEGIGGEVSITVANGVLSNGTPGVSGATITLNDTGMSFFGLEARADGRGGDAGIEGDVGNGGRGIGGFALIQANGGPGLSNNAITLGGNVYASASGYGGDGGSGFSDGVPQDGGTGGDGIGGNFVDGNNNQLKGVAIGGTAAGGILTINGAAEARAEGEGGEGGSGSDNGSTFTAGGKGGNGFGGLIQVGLFSGVTGTPTTGSASFNGGLDINAQGEGGEGGFGASDENGVYSAAGGEGGRGSGGFANVLQRGGSALINFIDINESGATVDVSGRGGDGGEGTTAGTFGRGSGGDFAMIASPRFQSTDVGTLQLPNGVTADVSGYAGSGTAPVTSDPVAVSGEFLVAAINGGTINAPGITIANAGVKGTREFIDFANLTQILTPPSFSELSATGGGSIVLGSGGLTLVTPGDLSLNVDALSSISTSGNVTLGGSTSSQIIQTATPNGNGVFSANAFNIFANSIDTSAILNKTAGSFTLTVPGAIKVGGLRAAGGNITVVSQTGGALDLGTIFAGGAVLLNVQQAAPTTPLSAASTITTGDITAGASVVAAGTAIAVGNVISGDTIGLTATTGGVTYGSLSAGLVNPVGQSQQGYGVGIRSAGNVAGGAIAARGNVGIVSQTGAITTGDISSQQQSIVLLGKGALSTGALTAGSTTQGIYVADSAMFAANNGSLDPTVYFGQAPTPIAALGQTPGSLTVAGTVTGRNLIAAATGAMQIGGVNLSDALTLGGGNITLGNVNAGSVAINDASSITSGTITTTGNVDLSASTSAVVNGLFVTGPISTGAITAGGNVNALGSSIATGNINAQQIGLSMYGSTAGTITTGNLTGGPVTVNARVFNGGPGGSIAVGDVTSSGTVGITAAGSVTAGSFSAAGLTLAAGGNVNMGNLVGGGNVSAGGSLTTGDLSGASVYAEALNGNATIGTVTVGSATLQARGGDLVVADIDAAASRLTSAPGQEARIALIGNSVRAGNVSATGRVYAAATTGNLTLSNLTTSSLAELFAATNVSLGTVVTGTQANAFTNVVGLSISNVSSQLQSGGTVPPPFSNLPAVDGSISVSGPISGGQLLLAANGAVSTGQVTSNSNVQLRGGSINAGNVISGDTIGLTATTGGVTYGSLSAGLVNPVGQSQQGYAVGIRSAGAVTGGAIAARGNVGVVSQASTITTGDISSQQQSIVLLSGRAVTTGSLNAGSTTGGVYIANSSMFQQSGGSLDPATYFAATPVPVAGIPSAPGTITVNGNVNAARFRAASNGTFRTGNITVSNQLDIRSFSNYILGDVSAPTIFLTAPAIQAGALTASGEVLLVAPAAINVGNITASALSAQAGGVVNIGNVNATNGVFIASTMIPQTLPNVVLPGTVTIGNIASTAGDITVFSQRGSVTTGNLAAAGEIGVFADAGSVRFGNATGANVESTAAGSITAGDVTATAGEIDFEAGPNEENLEAFVAGADITTGALVATDEISVLGSGNVTVASATINAPSNRNSEELYEIGLGAGGNLTVGNVSAPGTIGLVALTGNISAGNIASSQDSVLALAGGSASFGSVSTVAGGYVFVGNSSQLPDVDTDDGIDASVLLANAPVRAGGAVSFAGPVSTGRFDVASASGFAAGNLTASSVRVNTGGAASFGNVVDSGAFTVASNGISTGTLQASSVSATAGTGAASFGAVNTPGAFSVGSGAFTAGGINAASVQIAASGAASFNGAVTAPTINVASTDIAIGANGSLGNAATTALTLTNSGTGPSTLGGTAQVTGYTLDAAEIGRLRATQIAFNSTGNVTFDTAAINAANALNGATGGFRVATPGSIRITGNVDFTNMAATNTATFVAGQRFEIVTPTGQLRLLGAGNAVNGVANISATNVAVGNAALLDQLAANPRFAGRDTLLGLGATGSAVNSAGYIQAGRLAFTVGNTLLIANSGTATDPAGFTAGTGGVSVAAAPGQGTVDVVIFGRSLDASGTPTSSSGTVSTVMIAPGSTGRISTTSSVNGCGFDGTTCTAGAVVTNTVQNQLTQIAATIQSAVTGIGGGATNGPAGGSADNDGTASDNAATDEGSDGEDDGATAAAQSATRVNVLIDTSSIGGGGPVIDTPVTSSGNSSLWGGDAGSDIGSTGAGGLGDTSGPLGDLGGSGGFGGATGGGFGGAAGTGAGGASFGGAAGGSLPSGTAPTGGTGSVGGAASAGAGSTGNAGSAGASGSAGGSASTGGTGSAGSAGGAASAGGSTGNTAGSGNAGGSAAGGSTGGTEGGGSTGGQGGGTAATPAGESNAGASGTAATTATEGTSNSGGGGGGGEAGASEPGATPGGAAGGAAGSGGNSGGGNKDEKTDKPQGGTTGGIN